MKELVSTKPDGGREGEVEWELGPATGLGGSSSSQSRDEIARRRLAMNEERPLWLEDMSKEEAEEE